MARSRAPCPHPRPGSLSAGVAGQTACSAAGSAARPPPAGAGRTAPPALRGAGLQGGWGVGKGGLRRGGSRAVRQGSEHGLQPGTGTSRALQDRAASAKQGQTRRVGARLRGRWTERGWAAIHSAGREGRCSCRRTVPVDVAPPHCSLNILHSRSERRSLPMLILETRRPAAHGRIAHAIQTIRSWVAAHRGAVGALDADVLRAVKVESNQPGLQLGRGKQEQRWLKGLPEAGAAQDASATGGACDGLQTPHCSCGRSAGAWVRATTSHA